MNSWGVIRKRLDLILFYKEFVLYDKTEPSTLWII